MSDERVEKLGVHLDHLAIDYSGHPVRWPNAQASSILADPQAHVDALVFAGVLRMVAEASRAGNDAWYAVVQPEPANCHDNWQLMTEPQSTPDVLVFACRTCGSRQSVSIVRSSDPAP